MLNLSLLVCSLSTQTVVAQDKMTLQKGEGTGSYCLTNDISPEQAKQKAILNAKKNAIETRFGTSLQSEQRLQTSSNRNVLTNQEEIKEFFSKSIIEELKGEFVKQPEIFCEQNNNNNQICFTCKVKGEMMSVNNALNKAFEFNALNKAEKLATKNDFTEGESFYIHFKSAVDGYLSIFFIANGFAYRILPYQNIKNEKYLNSMPIRQDNDYIFFDIKNTKKNYPDIDEIFIDELNLSLDKAEDVFNTNSIVLVFGKQAFDKPILTRSNTDNSLPAVLPESDFRDWLIQNKITYQDFTYRESILTIKKNKNLR